LRGTEKVLERLHLSPETLAAIENVIVECEEELDDSSEGLITNDRYEYIEKIIKRVLQEGTPGRGAHRQ